MARNCTLCGRVTSGAPQNQPISDDPAVLDRLLVALRERTRDLEEERLDPAWAVDEIRHLCAGCRGLLSGITGTPSRQELIQHLRLQIRLVEARLEAEEHDLDPAAQHSVRLPGPGDRAEE